MKFASSEDLDNLLKVVNSLRSATIEGSATETMSQEMLKEIEKILWESTNNAVLLSASTLDKSNNR